DGPTSRPPASETIAPGPRHEHLDEISHRDIDTPSEVVPQIAHTTGAAGRHRSGDGPWSAGPPAGSPCPERERVPGPRRAPEAPLCTPPSGPPGRRAV